MPTEPTKFRKKPVVIEAMQFTDESKDACLSWVRAGGSHPDPSRAEGGEPEIVIPTRDGDMRASLGDWVIKEANPVGDRLFYPCKPDIFEATYEEVTDD